jgi:hypothetical protein
MYNYRYFTHAITLKRADKLPKRLKSHIKLETIILKRLCHLRPPKEPTQPSSEPKPELESEPELESKPEPEPEPEPELEPIIASDTESKALSGKHGGQTSGAVSWKS